MKRHIFFLALSLSACGMVNGELDPSRSALTPEQAGGSCSGAPDTAASWLPSPAQKCPELHIVGIYESRSDHSASVHPTGKTRVRFGRAGDNILVLSAYEPTHWQVELAPGGNISRVILNGYHDQSASVPAGIPIEIFSSEGRGNYLGAYGYAWPSAAGGSDTPLLVRQAEQLSERRLASFHGCYRLTDVEIRGDLTSSGDCPTAQGYVYGNYIARDQCGSGDGR